MTNQVKESAMRQFLAMVCLCSLVAVAVTWADEKKADDAKFTCLDLQTMGNSRTEQQFSGDENGEGKLAQGQQAFEGVKFKIGPKYIQLGSTQQPQGAAKVTGIKVSQNLIKLHILHATGWSTDEDTIIGEYIINWEDDTSVSIPIRYGKDLLDWWYDDSSSEPAEAKVAWKGANRESAGKGKKIRLYLVSWENPKPDKKVKTIDFVTTKETACAPFCVAITAEAK
jgi:hypothetical protein